jgi:bifunctional non-homologous end joining protein LigD
MIIPQPMTLVQQPEPFDDWDWLYEIKHDGFRALAVIEHGQCRFFSRKKHRLTGYQDLRAALVKKVNAETAILDGELAVADHLGRSVFADMIQRRHLARYFAFDLLSAPLHLGEFGSDKRIWGGIIDQRSITPSDPAAP